MQLFLKGISGKLKCFKAMDFFCSWNLGHRGTTQPVVMENSIIVFFNCFETIQMLSKFENVICRGLNTIVWQSSLYWEWLWQQVGERVWGIEQVHRGPGLDTWKIGRIYFIALESLCLLPTLFSISCFFFRIIFVSMIFSIL